MTKQKYVISICISTIILFCFFPTCVTTAPADLPSTGTVWFVPAEEEVTVDSDFTLETHVNTGNQRLAAYAFSISYPPDILDVNTDAGINGVEAGPEGFLIAVNVSRPGSLNVGGYDINGKGPDNDLNLITIHWKAIAAGYIKVNIKILNLNDEKTHLIGTPKGTGAKIKIRSL
jgi:hypothetical protein